MSALGAALRALWGLFVDDAGLALGLLLWCALAGPLLPTLTPGLEAPMLVAGAILALLADLALSGRPGQRPGTPRADHVADRGATPVSRGGR